MWFSCLLARYNNILLTYILLRFGAQMEFAHVRVHALGVMALFSPPLRHLEAMNEGDRQGSNDVLL